MKWTSIASALLASGLAVAGLAPLTHASLPPWSLDEVITINDDQQHATRTWHIVYDARVYSKDWTLAIPAEASFVSAYSAHGALSATQSNGKVTIATDGGDFFAVLREPLLPSGAFLAAAGGPSAAPDSPTSVRYELPAGWTLAGWAASPGLAAPANATWRGTGPFFVEALLLPAGIRDPGPDARGVGGGVAREANATVTAQKATLDITIVYDTDQYAPAWIVPVAEGTTLAAVSAPLGSPTFTVKDGVATVETPYPFAHHLGARAFTLSFESSLWRFGGGFLRANLSVPAGANDSTTLRTTLQGVEFVGARSNGELARAAGTFASKGPLAVGLVVVPASTARTNVGPFIVEAPPSLAGPAKAAADAAAAALASASSFAGAANAAPMHVIYTNEPVFQWEEGVYSGNEAISIRASDLSADATNITPVRTLVHEATHALVDQMRKGAPIESSFLNEGLSRLSEVHVELGHPQAVVKCVTDKSAQRCTRDSSRIDAAKLQAFYKQGGSFDVGWSAAKASEEERTFDYDYSGFVLASYERHAPSGALGLALQGLVPVLDPTTDDIIGALLHEAPGMTRDQLLYPGRENASLPGDAFAAALGDLVAPPFPKPTAGAGGIAGVPGLGAPSVVGIALVGAFLLRRRA